MVLEENINELSDELLVDLVFENQNNFLFLVDRYKFKLLNYIKRLTNVDTDGAQDILQDVFIKVYLNLRDFDRDLKFSSWIYRIAHNQVISNYRRLRARPEGNSINIDDLSLRSLATDLDISATTDSVIFKNNLAKVLTALNPKYREILVLKFLEEKSYQEISDILKKPSGTVASLINKAKREFKLEMEKQKISL